jgi:hypothetical protein
MFSPRIPEASSPAPNGPDVSVPRSGNRRSADLTGSVMHSSCQAISQPRGIVPNDIGPELLGILRGERDRMSERIDFLSRNRDSIASYIDEAEAGQRTAAAAGGEALPA